MQPLPSPPANQSATAGKPLVNRDNQSGFLQVSGDGFISAEASNLANFKSVFDAVRDGDLINGVSKSSLNNPGRPTDQPKEIPLAEDAEDNNDEPHITATTVLAERATSAGRYQKRPVVESGNATAVQDVLLEKAELRVPAIGQTTGATNHTDTA
ncbi:MAG: hypothetical protein ACSHWS_16450, partial [Sulfitobacter sp.]